MLTNNNGIIDVNTMRNRRFSLLTRTDSVISSSDCFEMLTNTETETSSISTAVSNEEPTNASPEISNKTPERFGRVRKKVDELWNDFLDGLAETNEQIAEKQPTTNEKLNPVILQRDIFRCLTESHVYLETLAGVREYFIWRNPLSSLCAFCVLAFSVWREFEVTVVLALILLQLGINYLETQKNISIGLHFLPRQEIPFPKFDFSGMKLVFEAARQAQKMITFCADFLEKLRALFMWKNPDVTFRFVLFVSFFFFLSLFTSFNTFFVVVGLLIVGKMFIMTRMYYRFPKTRYMFDIAFYFYRNTPISTDRVQVQTSTPRANVSKKRSFPFLRRETCPVIDVKNESETNMSRRSSLNPISSGGDNQSLSMDAISDVFLNDDQEDVIFKISRTCTMTDNSSKGTSGVLVLTEQQLEFSSKPGKKNVPISMEISLASIVWVKKTEKMHPITRFKFGKSKGIELYLRNNQSVQFSDMSKRDEFHEVLAELVRLSQVDQRAADTSRG